MIESLMSEFGAGKRERHAKYLKALGWHNGALEVLDQGLAGLAERSHITPSENSISLKWLYSVVVRTIELADCVSCLHRGLTPDWSSDFAEGDDGIKWLNNMATAQRAFVFAPRWGSPKLADKIRPYLTSLLNDLNSAQIFVEQLDPVNPYEIFAGGFELVPTFGLFPVYLLDERRAAWDVVPFAEQTKVSIMAHRDAIEQLFPGDGKAWLERTKLKKPQLNMLIHATERFESVRIIYRGAGHAAFKIILSLLEPEEYLLFRRKLRSIADCELKVIETTGIALKQRSEAELIGEQLRKQGDSFSLFVADCGDECLQELSQRNKSLIVWDIEHDLRIPVGVGFSLASLPLLLARPKILTAITSAADRLLSDLSLREALENEGLKPYEAAIVSFNGNPVEISDEHIRTARERLQELEKLVKAFIDFFNRTYKNVAAPKEQAQKKLHYDGHLVEVRASLLCLEQKAHTDPGWFMFTLLPGIETLEKTIKEKST
jgi:hypothetical protein